MSTTYFAIRSQVSVNSAIACMIGLIFVHIAVSIGTLVLSCFASVFSPAATSLASAAPTAIAVGSGVASSAPSSPGSGSSWGCLPVALLRATDAIPLTKLLASCSTASPLWFSGAPVALS